ncbi:unnamed protein product [Mytilus coruscus]|uniref:DDE-1 domain-containing protein n=1 Tax=Mytilus coruscus TaxID=42192 RepID=A0A6J8B0M9_MYTCO|nr:unnamed protein product [Mytilus coruscus]
MFKPRSLEIQRAKCGSVANVEKYFASLEEVVNKYYLQDKPHLIFNIDEKGITLNHKPPNVVSGIECNTSSVTYGRSSTTTILGCGSASGFAVPPLLYLKGKEWKSGIYPLDRSVINKDQLKPSEVFTANDECKKTYETKTDYIQVDTNGEVTEAVESAVTDILVVEDLQDHDVTVPHFFAVRIN